MKKLALIIAAALCLAAPAMAETDVADFHMAQGKTLHVEGEQGGKYIEVKTDHTTYRIYPCGQLEKLTWKELNPNEDTPTITYVPATTMELRGWNTITR